MLNMTKIELELIPDPDSNSSKRYVLEVDLEYFKELRGLHNDYPLALDKIKIKRDMLSNYQSKIADLITSLLEILKNQCLTFLIETLMRFIMKIGNFT